jgi:hypothetical protein
MQQLPAIYALLAQAETTPLGRPAGGSMALSSTLAAGAVFVGVLLVGFWYQRRQKATPHTNAAKRTENAALANDLTELTERLANELDIKAERIEALLAAADDRIRHLERLSLETSRTTPDPRLIEPRHRVRHESYGTDASHKEVYELADSGLSAVDIARKLDKPTGQVELILNLRRGTVAL